MSPWLRRNWIGLVAVVVLLPTTVGITFATQWNAYFSGQPSAPTTVAVGETADFGTAEWRLQGSERIAAESSEGARIGLPEGTVLVVVTVAVTPGGGPESPGCLVRLEEFDGATLTRSWDPSTYDPISFPTSEGAVSYCATDTREPYLLESSFVVTADAVDGLALSLTVPSEIPRYLSFRL